MSDTWECGKNDRTCPTHRIRPSGAAAAETSYLIRMVLQWASWLASGEAGEV